MIKLNVAVTSINPILCKWITDKISVELIEQCVQLARQNKPWPEKIAAGSQHAPKTLNKAGYRKHFDAKDADGNAIYTGETYSDGDEKKARDTEFYVFTETFRSEICAGYDYKVIQKLLDKHGALIRPNSGKAYTRSERLPAEGTQNIYKINSKVFGLSAENDVE